MAQHTNYWSCTAFADWVRGTKKIVAGTSEEWDDWTTAAQMKHNFRYWLAEEALGHIQDFVTAPVRGIYAVKYYINNRWVTRTNSLTAHPRDIRPGQWKDVGNRFFLVFSTSLWTLWKWNQHGVILHVATKKTVQNMRRRSGHRAGGGGARGVVRKQD